MTNVSVGQGVLVAVDPATNDGFDEAPAVVTGVTAKTGLVRLTVFGVARTWRLGDVAVLGSRAEHDARTVRANASGVDEPDTSPACYLPAAAAPPAAPAKATKPAAADTSPAS